MDQILDQSMDLETWRELAVDMLIEAYVPEADTLTREEALELALARDLSASVQLENDTLNLEGAVEASRK